MDRVEEWPRNIIHRLIKTWSGQPDFSALGEDWEVSVQLLDHLEDLEVLNHADRCHSCLLTDYSVGSPQLSFLDLMSYASTLPT
jgi:hypothetical protein